MDGVGRRALLTGALGLLLAGPARSAVSDRATLLRAYNLPMVEIGAYLDLFGDFQQGSAPLSGRDPQAQAEAAAVRTTGETRLAEGASFLRDDGLLTAIARYYAAQMAAGAGFMHQDAGGRRSGDRIALLHRRLVGVSGENLFTNSAFDPNRADAAGRLAVDSLMQSPGHRANILDPRWTHVGMGAAVSADGFFLVQLFAERVALLAVEMPRQLPAGVALPLGCQQAAEGTFSGMALVPLDREVAAADFRPPGALKAPATPGLHRSFFARPKPDTARTTAFTIHPGPMMLLT